MKAETSMRRAIVEGLVDLGAFPVENSAQPGTPDVAFAGGWIELKRLACWPKRAGTIVRLPHFTYKQRAWLLRHDRAGGMAFVLLRVDDAWLLFLPTVAAKLLGRSTRSELERWATNTWRGRVGVVEAISDWLRARCGQPSASCSVDADPARLKPSEPTGSA